MQTIWAETALTPEGWQRDVLVTLDAGRIKAITPGAARRRAPASAACCRRRPTPIPTPSSAPWPG